MPNHVHDGECKWCALDLDFDLPQDLVEAYTAGKLVIFAGAGISTEVPTVLSETLFERARKRAGSDADTFPEVMQAFQEKFGRAALVKEIRARFTYADSFPTARRAARQFHEELATLPGIRDIITTNWDTYFEEACLATPFMIGEDIAYHDEYERRVFKIHGSISNLATLVATSDDYVESLARLGSNALGAHLRQLLATKTVVFVGYSLTDWNFRRLYESLRADLGKFAPRAYVVSPFEAPEASALGLTHLRTSGMKFVKEIKRSLQGHCILPDETYDLIARIQSRAERADRIAKEVDHKEYPSVVYTWFYSDAVLDACFRVLHRRGSGEYSDAHHVQALAHSYAAAAQRAFKRGNYGDASYLEGYFNVMVALLSPWMSVNAADNDGEPAADGGADPLSGQDGTDDDEATDGDDFDPYDDCYESFPHFYLPGIDLEMDGPDEFQAALEASRRRAPRQRALARSIVANLGPDMVFEHTRNLPDLFATPTSPGQAH
ncbi:SIR2 family protein [Microbacterium sp. Au-Mic1]|uniref:SIR2 family protein n=1 Tax=Microbacterium sp. Au-Mic1 TaxID=2906457 RepID=UPI001E288C27|nr:SIR2 family protein [Microbacterium sp. Au-Mic1]MCE4027252.1 SIR2 family protein [Microbacterium sp. Au-Mic1]